MGLNQQIESRRGCHHWIAQVQHAGGVAVHGLGQRKKVLFELRIECSRDNAGQLKVLVLIIANRDVRGSAVKAKEKRAGATQTETSRIYTEFAETKADALI